MKAMIDKITDTRERPGSGKGSVRLFSNLESARLR